METGLTDILLNSGVAGAFCVFAIIITREFVKYLSSQSQMWLEFLAKERATRTEQMTSLALALQGLTKEIGELRDDLESHDTDVKTILTTTPPAKTRRNSAA